MKKVVILIVLLFAANCFGGTNETNQSITLWVSAANPAYQNTDLSVMLGYRQDDIETGIAGDWRMFSEGTTEPDMQSIFALGPYGVLHFPTLIDVNMPFADKVPWLPKTIVGEPFVGIRYLFDLDGKGTSITPFAGARLVNLFAVMYEFDMFQGSDAPDKGKLALSIQYKF
jgi:hypothetical protein